MPATPSLSRFQSILQRIPLLRSRNALIGVGIFIVILLFIYRLSTRSTAEPIVQTPVLQSPTGSEGNITFDTASTWPTYAPQLAIYPLASFTPVDQGAQAWAQQIGLQPFGAIAGQIFTNPTRTIILSLSPEKQAVNYTNDENIPTETVTVSAETAREHMSTFLSELGYTVSDFQINEQFIDPEGSDHETAPTSSEGQATAVRFELTQRLNTYPLRWEAGNIGTLTVYATNIGVYSAQLPYFPLQIGEASSARSFSQEEIDRNIEAGGYIIVGTVGRGIERGKLIRVTGETITPEYRVSSSTQRVAPYLLIQGTGFFADGSSYPVQITTPLTR